MELRLRRTEDVEEKVYKALEPWCRLSLSQVPFDCFKARQHDHLLKWMLANRWFGAAGTH